MLTLPVPGAVRVTRTLMNGPSGTVPLSETRISAE